MKSALSSAKLYAICDLGYLDETQALPVSRALLEGGAGILQLRAKGHDPQALLPLAKNLKALCEEFSLPFIVNDHPQLALKSEAHGLHLGQDDGSLLEAQQLLGKELIYGRSTHASSQAAGALEEGFDYIGFGPLFPTPTKKGRPGIGLENIAEVERQIGSQIPVFCIGGIKPENLPLVIESGAQRAVIVSHLLTSQDPTEETKKILQNF